MTEEERWKLAEQLARAAAGELSHDAQEELNAQLRSSQNARREAAEILDQDATLRFDQRLVRELAVDGGVKRNVFWKYPATAAAAALIVSALWWQGTRDAPKTETRGAVASVLTAPVATLVNTRHCTWGSSDLPTAEGTRVSVGSLELRVGLASVRFDSGAVVTIEGPSSVELVSATECRLVRGAVVVDVSDGADGFVVDAGNTRVTDLGTRFAVSTDGAEKSLVQVLEGLVEVERKGSLEPERLRTGESANYGNYYKGRSQAGRLIGADEPLRWRSIAFGELERPGWEIISTASGTGRDTYIRSHEGSSYGAEPYFRVKHSSTQKTVKRKGYCAFDLTPVAGRAIQEAEFILHLEPSDLGFATLVGDATFHVYGLTDEGQDIWGEQSLTWENAPAHTEKHPRYPVLEKVALLGKFSAEQGESIGAKKIEGAAIVDFLNRDTNSTVTFIICRETDEDSKGGLVHAFASKEHPANTPPLLRLRYAGQGE